MPAIPKTTTYLKQRYLNGLARKLNSLPADLPATEKKRLLLESLQRMMAYDRQKVHQHTARQLMALQRQKLEVVGRFLQKRDQAKQQELQQWLRQ